ncbi:hypothetical protein BI364_02165 [Acidihalobacter yilgarnensis]|uniref:Thioredoxin domain-containing protein n=1 Tax=Acidihalobacter yilgarnensis TaxID=2819280 RepID=A0A1D8ISM5_9GAMM|nr:TlpA disulfide reductase family protein [Acidihalobacter yilgarnensis]AOU99476.1 hypothetical protein BI364_02165 [Acidihalobacter yilgarnensis]
MKSMRIRIADMRLLVALFALLVGSGAACADAFSDLRIIRPHVSLPAPDLDLSDLGGRTTRLSDLRGKIVILNFWATFCAPCREELPSLQRLARRYADKGVVVLAVAEDRGGRAAVAPYLKKNGFTLPVLLDPSGAVRKRYEVRVFPMTYIIGRDGHILGLAIGARDWFGAAARRLLDPLINTPP